MSTRRYPYTPMAGPFKGRTFFSKEEYEDARIEGPTQTIGSHAPFERKNATSANGVTRKMAESLVQLLNVALSAGGMVLARRDAVLGLPAEASQLALDAVEAEALVRSVMDTAAANKWFANLVVRVCSVQSTGQLGITVGAIVAVRLARRRVIPTEVGGFAYMTLASVASADVDVPYVDASPNGVAAEPETVPS